MNKEEYKKMVEKHTPKEPRLRNIGVAFLVGGFIGFIGEFLIFMLTESFGMSQSVAGVYTCLIIIGGAS